MGSVLGCSENLLEFQKIKEIEKKQEALEKQREGLDIITQHKAYEEVYDQFNAQ